MPSNQQIGIKNNKRELRKSIETLKLILINHPNWLMVLWVFFMFLELCKWCQITQSSRYFLVQATKLYSDVPKPLHEVDNYGDVNLKLKKDLCDKGLVHSLSNQTKSPSPQCFVYSICKII